jgi:filamentous hemagglutinin
LGDFRNTGFVFAENINIANTVENLINERRLANPGTVEFEAGGGNWVFERGQRAQPGGFMSAVNWNIDAQHIQSIGGTFEFKGMTDAQTAQFTAFLRAQLQSLYGENFTESDIRDAISQDFHANKKPNQLRMILAVVVAIIIVIVTQGSGAQLAATLVGSALGPTAALIANAAFTALLTSLSTQIITTGRIDFRALFQNVVVSALTAGLTSGLTDFVGGTEFYRGLGEVGQTAVNYGIRATVAGGISEASTSGSFGRAFTGSIVSSLAADGAKWIGSNNGFPVDDWTDKDGIVHAGNPVGNAIAHAILGCAAAAAGRQDCASGAIGAATSSLTAPYIDRLFDSTSSLTVQHALTAGTTTLVSGLVTTALGGNGVTGANAGANEVRNNYLTQAQKIELPRQMAACAGSTSCELLVAVKFNLIDKGQDAGLVGGAVAGAAYRLGVSVKDLAELNDTLHDPLKAYALFMKLKDELSTPGLKDRLGDAVYGDLQRRIEAFENAYDRGGTGSAEAGFILGGLLFDAATLVTGVAGVVRGGAVAAARLTTFARTTTTGALESLLARGATGTGATTTTTATEITNVLPRGYTATPNGLFTGPGGGSLTLAGTTSEGTVVFQRVGSSQYFTLDSAGNQVAVLRGDAANGVSWVNPVGGSTIGQNWVNGTTFQRQFSEATGLPLNTTSITVPLADGRQVTTIFDISGRPVGLVELKNEVSLSMSDQFRAQIQYADQSKIPYNLVVSPSNQVISEPLWDAILRAGGKVFRFDPVTLKLTPITVRPI